MYAEFKSGDRIGLGAKSVCPPPCASDLLSEVLQDLRLSNATYGRSELTAPWGIQIPFKEGVRFHFVAEGRCLMHGSAHEIANDSTCRARPLAELEPTLVGNGTYRLTAGGGGERSLIVCCTIGFEGPTANPLLEMLPPIIHVRRDEIRDSYIATVLGLMAEEVQTQRIGGATIMARLADIISHPHRSHMGRERRGSAHGMACRHQGPAGGAGIGRHPPRPWSGLDPRLACGNCGDVAIAVFTTIR
jgi:hypothetical protein